MLPRSRPLPRYSLSRGSLVWRVLAPTTFGTLACAGSEADLADTGVSTSAALSPDSSGEASGASITTTSPTTSTTGEPMTPGPGTNSTGEPSGDDTTGATTGADTTTGALTGDTTGDTTGGEPSCPAFATTPDDRFDALLLAMQSAAVSPVSDDPRPSGLAIAIVVDGHLRHVGGVGTRAKQGHALGDALVDADTSYAIASTSKWMHGVMVSALAEEGLLDLAAPITTVMPAYVETNGLHADITLHHLLTMTSGLSNPTGCYLASVSASEEPTGCAALTAGPGTVLEGLFDPARLASAPYQGFNTTSNGAPGVAPFTYSNWGIMLSGRIAEVAGGAPYPDLVAARVFAPAAMCTATYEAAAVLATSNYAVGAGASSIDGKCPEPELGHDSQAPWEPGELACRARDPNGGVRASATDVGRFAATFLADLDGAGLMLGQAAAHRMLCPGGGTHDQGCTGRVVMMPNPHYDTYGYTNFRQVEPIAGHEVYTHGGARPGYGALFWIVPTKGFAVVILANEEMAAYDMVPWATKAIDCWLNHKC